MELDDESIEAHLRARARALGRGRGLERPEGAGPARAHAVSARRPLGFRWPQAGAAPCRDCASEIAAERLAAMPGAARCMRCQRSFERRGATA